MIALWWVVQRKILRISKQNRITSLADFVASRYGKSALLGGLVTIIAVIGILPYISLQLKAVSNSFTILVQYPEIVMPAKVGAISIRHDTALWMALILAAFTIAFGTRHLDAAEHHQGMVAAIAFESLVKLLAFLAVGVFVTFGIYDGFGDLFARASANPKFAAMMTPLEGVAGGYANWVWLTILSMMAIMFLPRQFQVAVIENVDEKHLNKAIWLFPLYMLAINIFVLPLAFGGLLHFPDGSVDADTFVLTLPMAEKHELLALLVFIGGLSAATGMIIVETIALSTMVCNDLVMPVLLRLRRLRLNRAPRPHRAPARHTPRRDRADPAAGVSVLQARRRGLCAGLDRPDLVRRRRAVRTGDARRNLLEGRHARGALCGLLAGFGVWFYTLLLPAFARSGWLPIGLLDHGPFGIALLKPLQLFGLAGLDQITPRDDLEHDRQRRRVRRRVALRVADGRRASAGERVRRCVPARRRRRRGALLARHRVGARSLQRARALSRDRDRGQRVRRVCAWRKGLRWPDRRSLPTRSSYTTSRRSSPGRSAAPRRASWWLRR